MAAAQRKSTSRATPIHRAGRRQRLPDRALLHGQGKIIDLMAAGSPLKETLKAIALMIEGLAPPALCTVLLLQPDGKHLRHGAGPSLPEEYNRATNGLEIGPAVGSCGTAAYRKTPVIVTDIATDPLWEGPREFALSFGLRACWSMPVKDENDTVLGTIAMYYRAPREPSPRDFGLLEPGARLVRLALAQHRKEEELRAVEARQRLAVEAAGLGTYDIDLVTGKVVWSDRMKAIFGVPASFVPDSDTFFQFVHPDDLQRMQVRFRVWINDLGAAPRAQELRILRCSDGAERIISLSGRALLNSQGMASRAIGICADITESRLAEQRQRETDQKIHQLQKMEALGQLAGGIAHDLNNTLVPILGLSKLAMQELSPLDPLGESLALIHRSGERARDLVNQILTFSRHEEIARGPVDLAAMVEDSLALLRATIPSTVALDIELSARPQVWANRGQLDQVLTNLVTNAAQAIGDSHGKIRIGLTCDPAAKTTTLSVSDDGPGIDPAALQRLFEPFYTTKRIGEGTGLGLAVAHGIVASHGGRITVASGLGEGARFDVELPLFKHVEAPAPQLAHA